MIRVTQMLPDARSRLFLIEDDRPLIDAASLLADATRHLVVVCDRTGVMSGVVTRTDVVRQIRYCEGCACKTPCVEVMTREVTSCCPDNSLQEVWTAMKDKALTSVPIIDAERRPLGLYWHATRWKCCCQKLSMRESS